MKGGHENRIGLKHVYLKLGHVIISVLQNKVEELLTPFSPAPDEDYNYSRFHHRWSRY